jgi:sensor histidine kinase YesM
VDIMQGRFRGRLEFERSVDPQALDSLVPKFVLQPLVENAIKHGVEPREEGGLVTVVARREGATIVLEVRDTGDGLIGSVREGTGVRNTRERLQHLYGVGRQEFTLTSPADGGTVATLVIPHETDEGPAPTYTAPRIETATTAGDARRVVPVVAPAAARPGGAVVNSALGRQVS